MKTADFVQEKSEEIELSLSDAIRVTGGRVGNNFGGRNCAIFYELYCKPSNCTQDCCEISHAGQMTRSMTRNVTLHTSCAKLEHSGMFTTED